MTRLCLLSWWLLLAGLTGQPARAEPFMPGMALNQRQIADVAAAALDFMLPRTLEAIPLPQLAMWGLRGLSTLDPRLTPDMVIGPNKTAQLRLIGAGRILLSRPAPAPDDATGWGEAIAQLCRAAWDVSDSVRRAGTQGVISSFFDELFNHMDPYSRYDPPDEAAEDHARRSGLAGPGLTVAPRGGAMLIQAVQPDSPAAEEDVHVGDRLVAVDGRPVNGATAQAIAALLAGPEGSEVVLSLRARDGRLRKVAVARAMIPPETVTSRLQDGILFLRISGFAQNTGARLAQALTRAAASAAPPAGVVLDLRGNRGGVLRQAVAAANTLLADGVIATTAGRNVDAARIFRGQGHDLAIGLPVVVLVDGGTASSAEVLAAALSDQRRAVIVGSATLGKGLVQTITALPDGGDLLVTWSRILAPRGWPLQGLGVLPQICTSQGAEATSRQMAELARGVAPMAAAQDRHNAARPPLTPADVLGLRAACPAAEGTDADLAAARFLIRSPRAYDAALLAPLVAGSENPAPVPATPGTVAPPPPNAGLTPAPALSN